MQVDAYDVEPSMWRQTVIIATLVLVPVAPLVLAQTPPATFPATQPAALELPKDSPIRGWFTDLASPDAAVRDQAQSQLMGMSREELEGLRLLASANRPLAPNQAAALRDVVIHVFLVGEPYEPDPRQPFLGVRWPRDERFALSDPPRLGVPLEERIPGFPGFQMLRDGDLVLGVTTRSQGPFDQWVDHPTPSKEMLITVLRATTVDHPVIFDVLRQGQRLRVRIRLAAKPAALVINPTDATAEAFLTPRLQRAEAYWQQMFVPLLRANVS